MSGPERTLSQLVAELRRLVEGARSMPMSASVVMNRSEVLGVLDDLAEAARVELAEAAEVLSAKDDVVGLGRREADELVAQGRDQQRLLATESEVLQHAREQAETELAAARQQADALRREVDDYVDTKLAGFEVALERSLETVRRGRERLAAGDGTGATGLAPDTAGVLGEMKLPEHLDG